MKDSETYYIKEVKEDIVLINNSTGKIEYEVIGFEPSNNPPRLVVRDIDLNNRKPINYESVKNIYQDYPEYCI